MRLSEWVQVLALLIVAIAISWALGVALASFSLVPQFGWPVGLVVFAVALFGLALLVEWKSGGRL